MSTTPSDPLGGAESIVFLTSPRQCENTTLSWSGGTSPVRVEFYQQDAYEPGAIGGDWEVVQNGMFNVYYNETPVGPVLDWQTNVEAGKNLYVVIVDHTGAYSQNSQPFRVEDSDEDGCLTEVVKLHRRESLLPMSAVILLAFLILATGLAAYFYFLYRRVLRQEKRKRASRIRPTIDDGASSLYTSASHTVTEPYMIQRQLTPNSGYADTRRQSALSMDATELEAGQQSVFLYHNQGGNNQRNSQSSNPFSDDLDAESPISPATTVGSRFPLLKTPAPIAVSKDTDNYSINSAADSRRLSIKTAATKASSNEESDTLSRSTSLTASTTTSDGDSIVPQFFPIRLNEEQTGTWRSNTSSAQSKWRNPFN